MSIIKPDMPIGATVYVAMCIPANARADLQLAMTKLKRDLARANSNKNNQVAEHAILIVSATRNTWFAEELTSEIEHLINSEGLNIELATNMSAVIATKRALAANQLAEAAKAEALVAHHRNLIRQLERVLAHLEKMAEELEGVFGLELCDSLSRGETSCETVAAEVDGVVDEIEAAIMQ